MFADDVADGDPQDFAKWRKKVMRALCGIVFAMTLIWGPGSAFAEDSEAKKGGETAGKKVENSVATNKDAAKGSDAASTSDKAPGDKDEIPKGDTEGSETSLQACGDEKDNDGDGQADCADQDCQIYAICVQQAPSPGEAEGPSDPASADETPSIPSEETGHLCRDKKDNDEDGLVDCHEKTCQRYGYCRRLMYETPESPNKAPGLYINGGVGLALPNYRTPTAKTGSFAPYNRRIPFDPDIGVTAGLKLGYFPLKWLGAGVNFNITGTGANNRDEHFFKRDDPDLYRYNGTKFAGHIGGFIRLQWPFKRFVPFLDIALGYSMAKYTWRVYDADTPWNVVENWDEDDESSGDYSFIEYEVKSRHFTFALEPGFDIFVAKRVFAIGAHAWLPVVASNESSTDNVGILLHFAVTPLWREPKRLRPEFADAKDK